MRASLHKAGLDRRSPFWRALPAALLVLVITMAACSDNRGKLASGGDTSGAGSRTAPADSAHARMETATTSVSDSTNASATEDRSHATPARSDSAARSTPAPPSSDTARKRPQSAGPRPAKRVATTAAPDTGKAQPDTGKAQADSGAAKTDSGAAAPEQGGGELRDAYHQAPRDTVAPAVYDGWKQFNLNCARCHGEDVTGTSIAPHLVVSLRPDGPINTKELFVKTVCAGRPAKGMPAWCSLGLGMDKIQDIYSYVKGRSDGKIAPGRPAVREGT
jgi:mono/diheme cytochrome c family protein